MSQNTVTSDSTTGGSVTTGNSFVNGHFGSQFLYVANTLIGGNVSSNGALRIQANLQITNGTSNLVTITANSTQTGFSVTTNAAAITATANVTVNASALAVNAPNVVFSNTSLSGSITFISNTVYSGAVIVANGSSGANGSVLYSNGTGMYWEVIPALVANSGIIANADGIFVNANNGLVANSTGVFVRANTGIVANASGVFVNSVYIATIDANTAAFANASSTNTFTVGTASFFVSNGNLGIGNNAPAHRLRVDGTISLSGGVHANGSLGTANQALFSNGTGVYWANVVGGAVLTANNTDTQTFYIPMANATSGSWSNGVVSTTKLFFVPSTGTLNATIFNSLSDEQEKTNVADIPDSLDRVLALRGVEFNWRDNGSKSAGLIAQELEKTLPHLVSTSEAGTKSVNYNGIIAYLIEAIRELNNKLENRDG
jgi:hypothetical protein